MHDASGKVPLNYQPDLLDPLGRTIMISFRKLFLPRPSWFRRQFQQRRSQQARADALVSRFPQYCALARAMTPVQPVRGTQSLLGEDADRLATVVAAFDRVRRLYGFRRVEVPTIEQTAVFARTIGETTDVVSKEMYSFEDRGGESITLRPEFTAGICRAYLSEGWQQYAPLKVATHGSAFRYERPQKGRFREFHQLDAEIIGAGEPQADVELLAFADQLLKELGIEGAILQLNTLGDPETRAAWRDALVRTFPRPCGGAERRQPGAARAQSAAHPRQQGAPGLAGRRQRAGDRRFSDAEAADFFARGDRRARCGGVAWERAPRLVRGLDYYRHTAFEFVTDRLGAQGTVHRRRPL